MIHRHIRQYRNYGEITMDLNGKKTALNDESTIYQQQEELSEKEKLKQMSWLQKLDYFKSYYLMKVIAVLAVLGLVVSILYTALSPKLETVLSVAVIDYAMPIETTYRVKEQFESLIVLDEKTQKTVFEDYSFSYEEKKALQKFVLYNASGDLDITIMPRSIFDIFAPYGHFAEVTERLPTDLYMELSDYLVECPQMDELGNVIEGTETVYGICIDSSWIFEGKELEESIILGIGATTSKEEMIETFLRFLFSPEYGK